MFGLPYYWRLSGFYFLYFAVLGTLVPYWSLYLKEMGFVAAQIGLLMAVPQLTKLVAPNLWGWLADKTGRRLRIIRLGNLLAALIFLFVFFADNFWSMALLLAGYSFFWNAVLAQFEVITLDTLKEDSDRYSHVRLWGSVGFIVTVMIVGNLLDVFPVSSILFVMIALLWGLWFCTLLLPDDRQPHHESTTGLWDILKQPRVLAFFACAFLMQMSHGTYYTFYTIYLEGNGINKSWSGALWALGVISEVGMFFLMQRFLRRYSLELIVLASLILAAVRWWLIGFFADQLVMLMLAQLLHAASFASFHAAGIAWVHSVFGKRHAGQGQAFYSSIGFGAGWGAGAWISGLLWDHWQGNTFYFSALVALLGGLIALWLVFSRQQQFD